MLSAASPGCLSRAVMKVKVNGVSANAIVDIGSSESFVNSRIVDTHAWKFFASVGEVPMANISLTSKVLTYWITEVELKTPKYSDTTPSMMPDLCCDAILGHDFLQQFSAVQTPFGVIKPTFTVFELATVKVPFPSLLDNLTPNCKPVAVKSKHYLRDDRKLIDSEEARMLTEGIIEPSQSPW